MLTAMRSNKKNQKYFLVIIGLLILGLVGFGTGGVGGGQVSSIGTVGEQPISLNSYAQSLQGTVQRVSRQVGRNLTPQEIQSFNLQGSALQNVVAASALDSETARLELSVGDQQVGEEILANPAFSGLDGKFDEERYRNSLDRSNLSVKQYEEQTRNAIARSLVESSVVSGTTLAQTQAKALLSFAREARSFEWAVIDSSRLETEVSEPTDAQIDEQYASTPDAYTSPLVRKITYVKLSPEMLASEVTVLDEELQQAYDEQPNRFSRPARRAVDRVVFADAASAKDALERLNSDVVTFDQVIEERGLTVEDVDLGELEEGTLVPEVEEALFGTKNLGIVGPVETDLGPALYRINAIMDAQLTTFEEAKDELEAELVGERSRALISERVTDIEDLLAADATLEELATDTGMEIETIKIDASSEDGIAAYQEFREAAFTAQVGDFAEVLDLSDGGVFALRVDSIVEPALQQLNDVKDQVITDWKSAETLRLIQLEADKVSAKLETGATFASLDLVSTISSDIDRGAFVDKMPVDLTLKMFETEQGKTSSVPSEGTVVVARVDKITPFDATSETNAAQLTSVNTQLSNQVAGDLLNQFNAALQLRDGVNLNQNILNQVNAQILGISGPTSHSN